MNVISSEITSELRDQLQDLHGVCWNTDDDFDLDNEDYTDIMEFHRSLGAGHWYLPFHKTLSRDQFETETEAYEAAMRTANLH